MESLDYLQFIVALFFVLALIGALAWVARRFGLTPRVTLRPDGKTDKRLAIVEILPVDARRKLVLIRRDEIEHLVLLGAERDTVVETAIPASQQPSTRGRTGQ